MSNDVNTPKLKDPLTPKHFILGIQHLFAMFGATVLVPAITGLNPAIALLGAGIGTWIFHSVTKFKVPVFLGSSFAFLTAIGAVMNGDTANIPRVQGGIIAAGAVYLVLSLIIKFIGVERIKKLFPPVVVGPVIVVIGLMLSPSAITNASSCWLLALIVIAVIILVMCFVRGFFKLVPILFGLMAGYAAALIFDATGITGAITGGAVTQFISFEAINNANWFIDFGAFTLPAFDISSILLIAPIALVTFMEHIGDITTNGAVVGKDFFTDPGLHRTLLGDGLATMFAGLIGAPANTTYGENTGVLAVTRMYDPRVIRIAACFAIVLGLFGKFGAVLQTIPTAVLGGISLILFGMIASIGLRTLVEAKLNFSNSRNLIIVAIVLTIGLGLESVPIVDTIELSGLFVATVAGVVLNLILPKSETKRSEKGE